MLVYVFRRIGAAIPILAIVVIVTFAIIHLVPGNPAAVILGPSATAQAIAHLTKAMGLDKSLPQQFRIWLTGIVQGNFGYSVFLDEPVLRAIAQHAAPTLWLSLYAEIISILLSLVLGMLAAWYAGSVIDRILDIVFMAQIAIPDFILALELIYLFAVLLRLFPVSGYTSPSQGFGPFLGSITLPALVLGIGQAGLIARVIRDAIVESFQRDYVRVAMAKGASKMRAFFRHALRSSLIVPLTMMGSSFATLLGGVVILESVFNIPGLGWLAVNAILNKDYPTVQAVVMLIAISYITINLIVDMLYFVVDPRTRAIYQ